VQKRFEMTTLSRREPEPDVRVYALVTNLDEPVTLRAERDEDLEPRETGELRLTAAFGLWGDAETERAIISAMRERLEWLEDRRWARRSRQTDPG